MNVVVMCGWVIFRGFLCGIFCFFIYRVGKLSEDLVEKEIILFIILKNY